GQLRAQLARRLVEALLEQGADPNLVLPEGVAAIHLAAGTEREGGVRCLGLILRHGGDPNARSAEALTPLHVAASWGCHRCLELLLRTGGDPELRDQDGKRAVDLALEQGNRVCAQVLRDWQRAARCLPPGKGDPSPPWCTGLRLGSAEPSGAAALPALDGDASDLEGTGSSDATVLLSGQPGSSPGAGGSPGSSPTILLGSGECECPADADEPPQPLSDATLLRELHRLGADPGPVTALTRRVYVQRLAALSEEAAAGERRGANPRSVLQVHARTPPPCPPRCRRRADGVPAAPPGHSPELAAALETCRIPDCADDELALARQFDCPNGGRRWRGGTLKSSFNYLLLDPRATQDLPLRSHLLSPAERFRTFVQAIFYVGKGTRARPYCHLYEALSHYRAGKAKACPKVRRILEIWASGQGVLSVHCFQSAVPAEAFTREACLVEAIGLRMLTNQKKGNCYGVAATWPTPRRRRLGVHMLHRAMRIFLAEGERQLRPADIQAGR
uniref:Ankyrin repeat and LEM domain containing 1 n=1 Tax=Apteryx owenii TaxID=8824 RepID=A0A8B9P4V4_APTOW